MLKPRRLEPGSRLAVVAPASSFDRDEFDRGIAEIERLGFEPVYDESVFARQGPYLAGSAELRASAFRKAWVDPSIAGLIAVRGGFGSAQVLPFLDRDELRASPKALIGYSDITSLFAYLTTGCGLVAFHGPMLEGRLAKGEEGYDRDSFRRVLGQSAAAGELITRGVEAVRSGDASGPLFGGTMTQLTASLGTPFAFAPPPGHVLFLEEVGERPYRLDRMITQLAHAGILSRAVAIVIAELPRCDEPSGEVSGRAVMADLFKDFPGPVISGFPSGHTNGPSVTLPLGVRCRVLADPHPRLIVEEAAVV